MILFSDNSFELFPFHPISGDSQLLAFVQTDHIPVSHILSDDSSSLSSEEE